MENNRVEYSLYSAGKLSRSCQFSQLRNCLSYKEKPVKQDDMKTKFFLFFGSQFSEFSVQEMGDMPMQ
ncbi:hypothetical protein Y032_0048g1569 [Ancylostoma ceylanicum]|nr:hypothetical protein Y032_0048g1569 [Ancylostoma ceylanicum]